MEGNAQFTVSFDYTKLLSHGIEPVTFCFTVERLANCAKSLTKLGVHAAQTRRAKCTPRKVGAS